ncbi:MAG: ribosome small subunit-dependent GTPase A [Nitrosomonadaceae bacterium]|nr:ribosome small subunit-dependent GTPase A [Nitrosomonadaceae bacterium]
MNLASDSLSVLPVSGQIVAAFGRQYLVEITNGEILSCVLRGKKSGAVCGDQVQVKHTTIGQGVIEAISPRNTLIYRSNTIRKKLIAANITQIIIVISAVPSFDEDLVNRCLVTAENQNIKALIVLNKTDLINPTRAVLPKLSLYQKIGYTLLQLSAEKDITPLLPYLQGHLNVLVGQSGMGKSTLINALIPDADRATAKISSTLDSGRHTTTHAQLYHLDKNTHIIDSPGIQEFGLHHMSNTDLAWGFIEFHPYIGRCKFSDCLHTNEPDCALERATQENKIDPRRLGFYRKLIAYKT